MNKKNLPTITAIILVIIVSLFVTKPDDGFLKLESTKYAKNEVEKNMPGNEFRSGLVERITENAIENHLTFEDKFLWKEVVFSFEGKTRTIGYCLVLKKPYTFCE